MSGGGPGESSKFQENLEGGKSFRGGVKIGAAYRTDVASHSKKESLLDQVNLEPSKGLAGSRDLFVSEGSVHRDRRHSDTASIGVEGSASCDMYQADKERVEALMNEIGFMDEGGEEEEIDVPSGSWLISPSSDFAKFWDFFTALLLLFTAIVTPFDVAFLEVSFGVLFVLNRLVHLGFFLDTIISFFMPYQNDMGYWVMDQHKIAIKYLTTWFPVDLVSIVPFDLVGFLQDGDNKNMKGLQLLRLLRLFKLLRVLRAGRFVHRLESSMAINYSMLTLAKFVMVTISLAHWLGCGWNMVRVVEDAESNNWLYEYEAMLHDNFSITGVWSKYLISLYWSVATLSTLGYGDVIPTTDAERVYVVTASLVGASVYAYMVGNVCGIVANMDKDSSFYMMMDELNMFMQEKRIPEHLRKELRLYFRFRRKVNEVREWQSIMDLMSPRLRQSVVQHVHAKWVKQVRAFRDARDDFITEVAMFLKTETLGPHEPLVRAGEDATKMFIVEKGLLYISVPGKIVTVGGVLGEDMMYRDIKRAYSITTLTHALLLVLYREDLRDLLDQYPDEKARIHRICIRMKFKQGVKTASTVHLGAKEAAAEVKEQLSQLRRLSSVARQAEAKYSVGDLPSDSPPPTPRTPATGGNALATAVFKMKNSRSFAGLVTGPASLRGEQPGNVLPSPNSSREESVGGAAARQVGKESRTNSMTGVQGSSVGSAHGSAAQPNMVMYNNQIGVLEEVEDVDMQSLARATIMMQRVVRRYLAKKRLKRMRESRLMVSDDWDRMKELLSTTGLSSYEEQFKEEGIDVVAFARCSPCYLRQLGIPLGKSSLLFDEAKRMGIVVSEAGCGACAETLNHRQIRYLLPN